MREMITYDREPGGYRHWTLETSGSVATLTLSVEEGGGLLPGYELKLNSYDLGVDMELHDAIRRIRFENPQVRAVVLASGLERTFCSGANIYMLGSSSHEWKVNFCRFTNETRNGMEDAGIWSGLKFLAAVNGSCAGGGYELALACDEIVLVDDNSSAVSLPEAPLLGVLPGTGGLTRLTDKRRVRRDLADVFCTTAEGVRGKRALEWGLVDALAPPRDFERKVEERARALAAEGQTTAREGEEGVRLKPLLREVKEDGSLKYRWVEADCGEEGVVRIKVRGPEGEAPKDARLLRETGSEHWHLAAAREFEDAVLLMRTNESERGVWIFETEGDAGRVLEWDEALWGLCEGGDWFAREVVGLMRQALGRLEVTARSMFAYAGEGSCFAGWLMELALASDRSWALLGSARLGLSSLNGGALAAVDGRSRLERRFCGGELEGLFGNLKGRVLDADEALERGLVTYAPDELDWEDELRVALEERLSFSPDALTGLEANLRFPGEETTATRIFGRLSAWQNWIFTRPNATGERGSLGVFGKGVRAHFDGRRT